MAHQEPSPSIPGVSIRPIGNYININGLWVADPGMSLPLSIAANSIEDVSHVNKFGRTLNADSGVLTDVWDGANATDDIDIWTPPTAARVHNISSTSAADAGTVLSSGVVTGGSATSIEDDGATFASDGVAIGDLVINDTLVRHAYVTAIVSETELATVIMRNGANPESNVFEAGQAYRVVTPASTGASVIDIHLGLDENFEEQREYVVLNGTNNVATANAYTRITRTEAHLYGSGLTNAGTLKATAVTDGTVTAQIQPGNGHTLMAVDTVPSGKVGYIAGYYASLTKASGASVQLDVSFLVREEVSVPTTGFNVNHSLSINDTGNSHVLHPFYPYFYVDERSDVKIQVNSSKNDAGATAGFDMILMNKVS